MDGQLTPICILQFSYYVYLGYILSRENSDTGFASLLKKGYYKKKDFAHLENKVFPSRIEPFSESAWFTEQEAHGTRLADLSKTDIAYLQVHCSIFAVQSQQIGHTFDFAVKSQSSYAHHLNKLGRPCIPDVIYQDSASELSWF